MKGQKGGGRFADGVVGFGLSLAVSLLAGAQQAPGGYAQAFFSGPLEIMSKTRVVVQGQAAVLSQGSLLKGLDGRGKVVDLAPADFPPEAQVSVFLVAEQGAPRAAEVYRGQAFLLRGTVTDLKLAKDGYVETLTVDGRFAVAVGDADFSEEDSGGGTGGPPPGSGGGEEDPSVEVGDEVMLKGIVQVSAFTAVEGRIIYADDGDDEGWDSEAMDAGLRAVGPRGPGGRGQLHGAGPRVHRTCQPSVSKRPAMASRPAGEMSENCTATSTPSPGIRRSLTTCP